MFGWCYDLMGKGGELQAIEDGKRAHDEKKKAKKKAKRKQRNNSSDEE